MPRFFLPPEQIHPQFMHLTGDNAAHAKVLRLKCGDSVTVSDGAGMEYQCVVSDISKGQVSLVVQKAQSAESELECFISIYVALAKADKLEHVVQKATELGAAELIAFPSARSISRPDEKTLEKKRERWQKIAAAAAEQSGRGRIPAVHTFPSFEAAVMRAVKADLAVNFYENEEQCRFSDTLRQASFHSISLMTGPEGGYEAQEVALSREQGMKVCTLGKRILRCETAPLCALSALLLHLGEL